MNTVHGEHTWLTLQEAGRLTGKTPSALRMWVKRKVARGEQVQIKKKKGKHGDIMLIHSSEVEHVKGQEIDEISFESVNGEQKVRNSIVAGERTVNGEPLTEALRNAHEPLPYPEQVRDLAMEFIEYHDRKRNEWHDDRDKLIQGMMMYRYKFEELDRQVKALPAPPEVLITKLQDLEEEHTRKARALAQAHGIIEEARERQTQYEDMMKELKIRLQEEEHAKEAFRLQWEQALREAQKPWWKRLFGTR